jgi:nitrogen PTS system EIIA component
MAMGELIGANHVIVGLRVAGKTQLLRELARRVGAALSLDQRMILDALQTRENLGATGLGKGFALPHARLGVLQRSFVLFVRLSRPIDFGSIDGLPGDLVILLLTPENADNQHLATLAALSLMQRLRQAPDAAALHRSLARPDV